MHSSCKIADLRELFALKGLRDFFKFAERCMLTQKVQGFPEVGYKYLDQQEISETHPNRQFNDRLTAFVKRLTPTAAEVVVRQYIVDYLCEAQTALALKVSDVRRGTSF